MSMSVLLRQDGFQVMGRGFRKFTVSPMLNAGWWSSDKKRKDVQALAPRLTTSNERDFLWCLWTSQTCKMAILQDKTGRKVTEKKYV